MKLWPRFQAISAATYEKLRADRKEHHDVHLLFRRKIYNHQHKHGRQSYLQRPLTAVSWSAVALRKLPGLRGVFDQCRCGAV